MNIMNISKRALLNVELRLLFAVERLRRHANPAHVGAWPLDITMPIDNVVWETAQALSGDFNLRLGDAWLAVREATWPDPRELTQFMRMCQYFASLATHTVADSASKRELAGKIADGFERALQKARVLEGRATRK